MYYWFRVVEENSEFKILANRQIPAATELCTFSGKPMDYDKTLKLGNKESFALQVEKNFYLFLDPPYRYFNHCCEPNCGLTPDLKFIALKPISKDEELRWDYSTSMLEHHWTMKCSCNKPTCRNVVGDFTLLPKKLQEKYISLNIVQPFIVNTRNA